MTKTELYARLLNTLSLLIDAEYRDGRPAIAWDLRQVKGNLEYLISKIGGIDVRAVP